MKNVVPENSYLLKENTVGSCVSFTLINAHYLMNSFFSSLATVNVKADLDVQLSSVKRTLLFMPCVLGVFPSFQPQAPYFKRNGN